MNEPKKPSIEASEPETIPSTEEAGSLLDTLQLHIFHLLEDHAAQHYQLSRETSEARMILARVRLQEGNQRTAAEAQLPRCRPYKALCRLVEEARPWGTIVKLIRLAVEPCRGYLHPVTNIFGALVPLSLRVASRKWERCVDQLVDCANTQRELQATISSIRQLRRSVHPRYPHK
ncbi:uncharacterized protein LOC111066706 [Drosophila obscura]|uniref:uncharacterized protein LOC111066706 n=1 Tax=Drosophila obscura TaxID=7282 RepID=UPI001BB2C087|nr:uncharacterized protein LOC111066706 [Drosophila obscura]XP_022211212.2 uncharacterized protein LOC111066706 [Drosophila obscura]